MRLEVRLPLAAVLLVLTGCTPSVEQGFGPEADFTVSTGGGGPCGVVLHDFNGDAATDIALSHIHSSTVTVLLGLGDGSFMATWHEFPQLGPVLAGQELGVIAAGHLDGDEYIDFAVTSGVTNEVTLITHPGHNLIESSFATSSYPVGEFPFGVVAADFNGDDQDDLAVSAGIGNDMRIFLQGPAGEFSLLATYDVLGLEPGFVVTGDLDADGVLDLVTSNHSSSSVSIFLGLGTGEFGAPAVYAVGDGPSSPELVDIDGDGDLDLMTANEYSDDISLLLGDGLGGFVAGEPFVFGLRPYFVSGLDVDSDGDIDLVVPLEGEDRLVTALNDGSGGFDEVQYSTTGQEPGSVVHDDFDGDGDVDIAVSNFRSDSLSIFLNRFDEL
ncbi:MAG: VCBS repeat-containing protein [Myxococcota bacterium]|nr:VCBS repeat-containing protein [Myxococcota bacterium]